MNILKFTFLLLENNTAIYRVRTVDQNRSLLTPKLVKRGEICLLKSTLLLFMLQLQTVLHQIEHGSQVHYDVQHKNRKNVCRIWYYFVIILEMKVYYTCQTFLINYIISTNITSLHNLKSLFRTYMFTTLKILQHKTTKA